MFFSALSASSAYNEKNETAKNPEGAEWHRSIVAPFFLFKVNVESTKKIMNINYYKN